LPTIWKKITSIPAQPTQNVSVRPQATPAVCSAIWARRDQKLVNLVAFVDDGVARFELARFGLGV
jgi:hypothetical protein